ncbi:MAG: hypothetical protein RLP11_05310 [Marinoscillum sp.]
MGRHAYTIDLSLGLLSDEIPACAGMIFLNDNTRVFGFNPRTSGFCRKAIYQSSQGMKIPWLVF